MANDTIIGTVKTTTVGVKRCRPFILNVMVMIPESGYKFEVAVEKGCTAENDATWKLVFDLYKKNDQNTFDQIIHVSFTAQAPQEQKGIQTIVAEGLNVKQAQALNKEVFPAVKAIEGVTNPTAPQKEKIRSAMSKVTTLQL